MTKKGQNVVDAFRALSLGQNGTGDHDDGKAELTRGFDLGERAGASGIAGDDPFDIPRTHEVEIAGERKGAARNNDAGVPQRQRAFGRIDKSQGVGVLGLCGERREMLAADGEEYAGALFGQGGGGSGHVFDIDPVVFRRLGPRRTLKRDQRGSGRGASRNRVAADLGCKGMRGVDDMGDALGSDVVGKPIRAAETADASRQRLRQRGLGAAGVRIDRVKPEPRGGLRQTIGLARSAQNEGVHRG